MTIYPVLYLWPWGAILWAIALVLSLVLEFRRTSRYPWLRRLAVLILFVALGLWGLRPAISVPAKGQRIAWVTEAMPDSVVTNFLNRHAVQQVWEAKPGLTHTTLPTEYVPDGYYRPDVSIDSLWVLGEGLTAEQAQLDSVEAWQYWSHAQLMGLPRFGIESMTYQMQGQMGVIREVVGRVVFPDGGGMLYWESPAGTLDSIVSQTAGPQRFEFKAFPWAPGRYVHELALRTAQDTVREPFGVVNAPLEHLDILLISGFPTFEQRTLKNWLGEKGHRVAVRSQVAATRFRTEFINRPSTALARLNASTLEGFRLLILDAKVLAELSRAERSAIVNAVQLRSLGLWIQTAPGFSLRDLPTDLTSALQSDQMEGGADDQGVEYAFDLEPYGETGTVDLTAWNPRTVNLPEPRPYIRTRNGVYFHQLWDTYRLPLQGYAAVYDHYWSAALAEVSGYYEETSGWYSATGLHFEGQPMSGELILREGQPRAVQVQEGHLPIPLSLIQTYQTGEVWKVKGKGLAPGWTAWIRTEPAPADTLWQYVLPDTTWKTYRRSQKVQYWEMAESQQPAVDPEQVAYQSKEISPLWWFAFAILCLAFLWLEPKL